MNECNLLNRGRIFAQSRRQQLDETALLGAGQDGTVWRTSSDTAIKVFHREGAYACELAAYRRLTELHIARVNEFVIPRFIDSDDTLQVIEMDIVSPPYLLDFGKCYLDRKPDFSPEVWQEWQQLHEELWEGRWKIVRRAVWQLEKYGIYHVDPRPGNLRFAEE
jgi:hypothetical protein